MKLHLDTDIGGDIDDLAALAMLLRWPGVELTGITTVCERDGRRAGYVRRALQLAGREEIPVAAGADVVGGYYQYWPSYPPEIDFWVRPVTPAPGLLSDALALLRASIEQGAVIVVIGQCTNLALLDQQHPGILQQATIVLLGGYVYAPRRSRSPWGNEVDYNVQLDVASARHVLTQGRPTIVPLHVTVETTMRRSQVAALRAGDPLASLLAHQTLMFKELDALPARCPALPADFVNYLYDPLGCAVAIGWAGVTIEELPLRIAVEDGWLCQRVLAGGRPTRVVTRVDGPAFDAVWLATVTGARDDQADGEQHQ